MTYAEQLALWVAGESIHGDGEDWECCPDFSCCNKDMHTPLEERELFAELYAKGDDSHMPMLMTFLGKAIAQHTSKKVYMTDGETRKIAND